MADIFLIHWNEAEVLERADRLRAIGHTVRTESSDGARAGKAILAEPPEAVVVDLTRLPSHGRQTAHGIRAYKAGRGVPIIFLRGDPLKMDAVRQAVPDAIWATWESLEAELDRFITAQPQALEVRTPPVRKTRSTGTRNQGGRSKTSTVRTGSRKKSSRR